MEVVGIAVVGIEVEGIEAVDSICRMGAAWYKSGRYRGGRYRNERSTSGGYLPLLYRPVMPSQKYRRAYPTHGIEAVGIALVGWTRWYFCDGITMQRIEPRLLSS